LIYESEDVLVTKGMYSPPPPTPPFSPLMCPHTFISHEVFNYYFSSAQNRCQNLNICIKILEILEILSTSMVGSIWYTSWKYIMNFLGFSFLSHGTKEDKLHCKKGKEHNLWNRLKGWNPTMEGLTTYYIGSLVNQN
jgi:hypothetical protein